MDCKTDDFDPLSEESLEALFLKNDTFRQNKARQIKDLKSKRISLCTGLLIQKMLAEYKESGILEQTDVYSPEELMKEIREPEEIRYKIGNMGKPSLADYPVHYSLSHSGDYILCVFADQEIGCDLQKIVQKNQLGIASRFFRESEYEELMNCTGADRDTAFYRMWTAKEAYGKLTGEGVGNALKVRVDALEEVRCMQIPVPEGYLACVCYYDTVNE